MQTAADVLAYARLVAKKADTWIELHNAIFGLDGAATRAFPTESKRTAFADTGEYAEVMRLIDELRDAKGDSEDVAELTTRANGRILVRLPRAIHAALLVEAEAEGVSLNQLILAKVAVQLRALV